MVKQTSFYYTVAVVVERGFVLSAESVMRASIMPNFCQALYFIAKAGDFITHRSLQKPAADEKLMTT